MAIAAPASGTAEGQDRHTIATARRLGCLAAILALAIALRGWDLGERGFITPYYLAGVRSMLANWHNFLFNSFDPAGFVSLDKPPVAFWVQTLSAQILGFGPFSVLLPQLLEGVAAIALLYALVRRHCGDAAGLLAALFLALTPVAVAVDRSNNTESGLVLVLLAAAWALLYAVESGRLRYLLLSPALVGIGFNIKMLVAFGVAPAFAVVYLIGARLRWPAQLLHLAAAGCVLLAVAAPWVLLYELTPAPGRPFVDSTRENSMLELVVGHNGIQRFVHPNTARRNQALQAGVAAPARAGGGAAADRDFAPAGVWRLAAPRLAAQIGWLFPLALLGAVAAWSRDRAGAARAGERLQLLLWSGWALSYGAVFSAADGLFHAYYLVVMAPALSALAGIGTAALWLRYREGGAAALLLPIALVATGAWQAYILDGYVAAHLTSVYEWLGLVILLAATALAGAIIVLRRPIGVARGLSIATLAMLVALPAAWAIGTALATGNTGFPAARPPLMTEAAEGQRQRWGSVAGALAADPRLIGFLTDRYDEEDFRLVTVNARLAAPVIIATGWPVLALGGFSGGDPIVGVEEFARLVAERRVRFALIGDGSPGLRRIFGDDRQKELVEWIRGNGQPVETASWRSAADPAPRAAEAIGAQLYDLRPDLHPGGERR
jgi:4-amino-4-deoxy-L-arabinose transferase-like glycosyltransferase